MNPIKLLFPYFEAKDLWALGCEIAFSVWLAYSLFGDVSDFSWPANLQVRFFPFRPDLKVVLLVTVSVAFFMCTHIIVSLAVGVVRRFRYSEGADLLAADPRPPVLYLRSFAADSKSALRLTGRLFPSDRSDEDTLVRFLYPIGPVLALDTTNERLALLFRTPRLVAAPEGWQLLVLKLIGAAALIVVRAGVTPGLLWEMRTVFAHASPEKIWILLGLIGKRELPGFWSELAALTPQPELVASLPDSVLRSSVMVYFRKDWSPQAVKPEALFSGLPWGMRRTDCQAMLDQLHLDMPVPDILWHMKVGQRGFPWSAAGAIDALRRRVAVCEECAAKNRATREIVAGLIAHPRP